MLLTQSSRPETQNSSLTPPLGSPSEFTPRHLCLLHLLTFLVRPLSFHTVTAQPGPAPSGPPPDVSDLCRTQTWPDWSPFWLPTAPQIKTVFGAWPAGPWALNLPKPRCTVTPLHTRPPSRLQHIPDGPPPTRAVPRLGSLLTSLSLLGLINSSGESVLIRGSQHASSTSPSGPFDHC